MLMPMDSVVASAAAGLEEVRDNLKVQLLIRSFQVLFFKDFSMFFSTVVENFHSG